jgi:hypothetical protein
MRDFLLCHNPLARMPAGRVAYIYHPDNPRIFASIIEIDYKTKVTDFNFKGYNVLFEYDRGDGLRRIFVIMTIHGGDRNLDKTITVLKEAAGWYSTCLNKEDINTYGKGAWSLMHPYNSKEAPGLDVLHLRAVDQYVISYGTGTFCVDGEEEMHRLVTLMYKKDGKEIEEGLLNYV